MHGMEGWRRCTLPVAQVPLPYFHTLAMLQNICFALYSYALLAPGLGAKQ